MQLDDKHWSAPEFVITEGTYQWDDFLARMLLMANKCKLNQLLECSGFSKLDLVLGGLSSLCYSKWANRDGLAYQYNRCGAEFCDCAENPYQNADSGNEACLYENVLWEGPDIEGPRTVDEANAAQSIN